MSDYSDAEVLKQYEDGKKLLYLKGRKGLRLVGDYHRNCLYYHYFWTEGQYVDPPLEYFFLITHADGLPGILVHSKLYEWFRKPHPSDFTPEHLEHVTFNSPGWLHSTSYDEWYPLREKKGYSPEEREVVIKNEIAQHDKVLNEAKKAYETFRAKAIAEYGPLRKDHPLKAGVDLRNRAMTAAQVARDERMRILRLHPGRLFDFRGKTLILLSTTAKGVDYSASDTRYANKLDEFMGKDLFVPHSP